MSQVGPRTTCLIGLVLALGPNCLHKAVSWIPLTMSAASGQVYILSAAMPGVLPRAPMTAHKGKAVLTLPSDLAPLNSDRLQSRLKQFSRLVGGDPEIRVGA